MEKSRITEEQWAQLVQIYQAQNIEGFQSLCDQYGLDSQNICRLLVVMENVKRERIKYGIPTHTLVDIDERFLTEGVSMESDPYIIRLVKGYEINVCKLHTLYTKWYCALIEIIRIRSINHKWIDVYEDGDWFDLLCGLLGEDKMKELFKLYL